jgi:hypothetical protein
MRPGLPPAPGADPPRSGPSASPLLPPSLVHRRADLVEWMDLEDCDPQRLRNTFRRFPLVNRWISGWRGSTDRYDPPPPRPGGTSPGCWTWGAGEATSPGHLAAVGPTGTVSPWRSPPSTPTPGPWPLPGRPRGGGDSRNLPAEHRPGAGGPGRALPPGHLEPRAPSPPPSGTPGLPGRPGGPGHPPDRPGGHRALLDRISPLLPPDPSPGTQLVPPDRRPPLHPSELHRPGASAGSATGLAGGATSALSPAGGAGEARPMTRPAESASAGPLLRPGHRGRGSRGAPGRPRGPPRGAPSFGSWSGSPSHSPTHGPSASTPRPSDSSTDWGSPRPSSRPVPG